MPNRSRVGKSAADSRKAMFRGQRRDGHLARHNRDDRLGYAPERLVEPSDTEEAKRRVSRPRGSGNRSPTRSSAKRTGVRLRFVEPGRTVQNAFVESFNGRMRDECLNLHWFRSFYHARDEIAEWCCHYNALHPQTVGLGLLRLKR